MRDKMRGRERENKGKQETEKDMNTCLNGTITIQNLLSDFTTRTVYRRK